MANESLLQPLGIAPGQIHRMPAEGKALDEAAHEYQLELATAFHVPVNGRPPHLDVVLLGMGEDGHVASLFPETSALDEERRWVVSHHVPQLGSWRLTMTPILINAARPIIFLVAGAAKATCLAKVLEGPRDPRQLPAQQICPVSGQVTWFVDESAAAQLTKH
jgi:6-phosphogluconolactonase